MTYYERISTVIVGEPSHYVEVDSGGYVGDFNDMTTNQVAFVDNTNISTILTDNLNSTTVFIDN
jgi:hypothetical protein